ncbi:113_t:CDS:2 [Gigaspora rosea]|nr:113_t:CDS:2 [Gigaspora rosea]
MNEPGHENLSLGAAISTLSEIEFNTNECNKENTYASISYASALYTSTSSDIHLYRSNINKYEYGNNQYASILGSLASSEDHMLYKSNINDYCYENTQYSLVSSVSTSSELYELSTNEYYYKNTQHASIPHYLTLSEAHVIVLILFYHIRFFMNGSNMNEYGYENTQHASISDTSALLEVHVSQYTSNLHTSTSSEDHVFCESNDHNQENAPNAHTPVILVSFIRIFANYCLIKGFSYIS